MVAISPGKHMGRWNTRKRIDADTRSSHDGQALPRTLSWPHLIAMGVGAIVGTGILTLIGIGADKAGPAVLLSFLIAGFVCACAALAYAEMASMIPASGSAYTYSYVAMGEPPVPQRVFIGFTLDELFTGVDAPPIPSHIY